MITFTVVDGSILREATKRGQMANSHIRYVPLYRIRGIFSPMPPTFTREDIWIGKRLY